MIFFLLRRVNSLSVASIVSMLRYLLNFTYYDKVYYGMFPIKKSKQIVGSTVSNA